MGPESRAILKELSAIRDVLSGDLPKNIQQGELFYYQFVLDKSELITLKELNITGFNLFNISVSKGADISDCSYKILSRQGVLSNEIEARTISKLAGFNSKLFINNDTAEAGEFIYVDCFTLPPAMLSAITFNIGATIFEDSPSDTAAGNNSLSTLAHPMLYDSYNGNFSRQRGKSSMTALATLERTATVTSDTLTLYNNNYMYIYLYVTASTGGNLTCDILLDEEISGDSISIFSKGTFTASKLFALNNATSSTSAAGINGALEAIGNVNLPKKIKVKITLGGGGGTHTFGVFLVAC